jgi:hypothetical protein
MRGLRLYRVHKRPASPTTSSPARPGAVAADMEDEVRPWQVAHDGSPWRAAHDGAPWQVAHDGAHCQVAHDQGAPSRAQLQRLQKDGKPAAAAGVVVGADEGTGPASAGVVAGADEGTGPASAGVVAGADEGTCPASGPVESGHCGHLGPRVEELEDALAEAEAEGVRARAARTAAESSYVRLTPEEARARGFRDDEELVMPMPVDDSSDEED